MNDRVTTYCLPCGREQRFDGMPASIAAMEVGV